MNRDKRGILYGMALGDANISLYPNVNSAVMSVKHCAAQSAYAEHKADLITRVLGGARPPVRPLNNNGFPGVIFRKTASYLRIIRKRLYKDGRKVCSGCIRYLTPHGLAIWYMDDGGLGKKRRNGKIHAVDLYINCHSSIEEAHKICAEIKEKFGITFLPNLNNGSYRIRCGTLEARRFVEIVSPFMTKDMRYKIDIPPTQARAPSSPDL